MTEPLALPMPHKLAEPVHPKSLGKQQPNSLFSWRPQSVRLRGSNEVNLDINVPSRGFGIGTGLVRAVQKRLRDLSLQPRQIDVQTRFEEVTIAAGPKVHFGIDGRVGWKLHLHLGGNMLDRAQETGRPTCGKQLFGIRAVARAARNGKLYVQP